MRALFLAAAVMAVPAARGADPVPNFSAFDQRISELEKRVAALEGKKPAAAAKPVVDLWAVAYDRVKAGREIVVYVGTGTAPTGTNVKVPPRPEFPPGLYRGYLLNGRPVMEPAQQQTAAAPGVAAAGHPFAVAPATSPDTSAPLAELASTSNRVADLFRAVTPTPVAGAVRSGGTSGCSGAGCPTAYTWRPRVR